MDYKITRCERKSNNTKGFSLIELLIVIVIIAILVGISYPSYQSYLIKVRRVDGQKALLHLAANMEKSALMSNDYDNIVFSKISPEGYYALSIVTVNPQHFVIAATPLKSQIADKNCPTLAMNAEGEKGRLENGVVVADKSCW